MRGTLNRPCSAAGASASAAGAPSGAATASCRKTLTRPKACDVGGTSAVATSCTRATAPTITSSWAANRSSSASVSASRDSLARWATSSREMDTSAILGAPGRAGRAHCSPAGAARARRSGAGRGPGQLAAGDDAPEPARQPPAGDRPAQRPGDVPALRAVAADRAQRGGRGVGLDSLADRADAQRLGEPDQRPDRRQLVGAAGQPGDQGGIELDLGDAEPGELGERRVAGAEVVEGETDPQVGKRPDGSRRLPGRA